MKIGIVGGGAAGMVAAIAVTRAGGDAEILEAGDRLGQKILSTGNGKCNLGNRELDVSQYYSSNIDFVGRCISRFGTKEALDFFYGIGLLVREKNGYLYPLSEQASSVLDVLRNEVSALGIKVQYGFRVSSLTVDRQGSFLCKGKDGERRFDKVILTCGGKAAPKTGSDGSGYALAKELGHVIIPVVPALTYLKCEGDFFKGICGVRTKARITLRDEKRVMAREDGELQITELGLSGIPVFQCCRIASYALLEKKKLYAEVDFLPQYSEEELKIIAQDRWKLRKNRSVEEMLTGILNKKLMQLMIKRLGRKAVDEAGTLSEKEIFKLLLDAKHFTVKVLGTGDFHHAQVSAGGVDLRQIKDSFESKLVKNLYFAGEILDVDGRCGGYNLHWAWASGYLAGLATAGGKWE